MKILRTLCLHVGAATLFFGCVSSPAFIQTKILDDINNHTYEAFLPCASCSGIRSTLKLKGKSFVRVDIYGDEDSFKESGELHISNGIVTTTTANGDVIKYKQSGKDLILLQMDGTLPTGELKDRYIFKLVK